MSLFYKQLDVVVTLLTCSREVTGSNIFLAIVVKVKLFLCVTKYHAIQIYPTIN